MDYQVWTQEYAGADWKRENVGDLPAAKRAVLAAAKEGKETILTVEVPFSIELKVGEPGAEVRKTKTPKTPAAGDKQEDGGDHEADQDQSEQN